MKNYQGKLTEWGVIYWPKYKAFVIVGMSNGSFCRTSPIVTFAQANQYVETLNSIYILDGPPNQNSAQAAFDARYPATQPH